MEEGIFRKEKSACPEMRQISIHHRITGLASRPIWEPAIFHTVCSQRRITIRPCRELTVPEEHLCIHSTPRRIFVPGADC